MSTLAELTLNALRKHRSLMIVTTVISGIGTDKFISSLWKTGNPGLAWADWTAHGLPEIPVRLVFLLVLFAIIVAIEIGKQSQEDTYSDREDGYRSPRHD